MLNQDRLSFLAEVKLNRIIAFVVFAISMVVYGKTVAPTTAFWDAGEFVACSYLMGVPHPPGAPLFILIGRIMTMLPVVDDVAMRVNLFSAFISAATVTLTYLSIVRLIAMMAGRADDPLRTWAAYFGGFIGALAFAFSDSFWFNAVEAEVYALSMFFTALVVWLILLRHDVAREDTGNRILLLIAYILGLALGVHFLNILALPAISLIIYFGGRRRTLRSFFLSQLAAGIAMAAIYLGLINGIPLLLKESFVSLVLLVAGLVGIFAYARQKNLKLLHLIASAALLILIGYSSYATLYIRSGLDPMIDENDPETPARFASYLNREQYGSVPLWPRRAPLWDYQVKKMYTRYFGWQFVGRGETYGTDGYISEIISGKGLMGLPFLVGFLGMVCHFKRDWPRATAILALFIMTGIAIAIYLNQENPQVRERDYTYVGSFFAFALWIGLGAWALMDGVARMFKNQVLRRIALSAVAAILLVAVPGNLFSYNIDSHDRTGNYTAWDYSYNILQSCEPNAILFTNGDNDTFPIWYLQYVEGIRPDIRVVCLSLLNTPWYIKQLRDFEPRVPIGYSDAEIAQLSALLWPKPRMMRIDVSPDSIARYKAEKKDNVSPTDAHSAMVFKLAHSTVVKGSPLLLVQDRMILKIIIANQFKRPIYFSVTVARNNMVGLGNPDNSKEGRNYLRMDGMTYKVMPYGGPDIFISPENLEENLKQRFRYRNLNNPEVYINLRTIGLLQNYRFAFMRLANHYKAAGMKDKLVDTLAFMDRVMPEARIPAPSVGYSLGIGQLYHQAGRPEELEKRLDWWNQRDGLDLYSKLAIASKYSAPLGNHDKAESLGLELLQEDPDEGQVVAWLAVFYDRVGEPDRAIVILDGWLARNSGNADFDKIRPEIQRLRASMGRKRIK